MLVLFAVLHVDCEEWFCSLAGSLPGARRAIVCILFLLGQSQVVDCVVAEVVLMLRFSQLLLRRRNVSPRQFCHMALCLFLSNRSVTTKSCTFRWRAIAQVSLGGFRAFSDGPFSASVSPGSTFFVVQKVRAWPRDCCFS